MKAAFQQVRTICDFIKTQHWNEISASKNTSPYLSQNKNLELQTKNDWFLRETFALLFIIIVVVVIIIIIIIINIYSGSIYKYNGSSPCKLKI